MGRPPGAWNTEDLMDFEYFLYHDAQTPEPEQARELYITAIQPALDRRPVRPHDRRSIFRLWLDEKRKRVSSPGGPILPGAVFRQTFGFAALILSIAGFASGSGLSASFLTYHGKEPLNVATFLTIFVLSQISILLFGLLILTVSHVSRKGVPFSLVRLALWNVLRHLMGFIVRKTAGHLSKDDLSRMASAWGILKGRSRCYGNVFPWPLFILTQMFAVWFNAGVIAATVLRVLGTDLAFGWQSTLRTGSEAVYNLVRFISIPWSFVVNEPLAHPTLTQIEGTRMILKDGIARLATADLVSWWPFLCFCVIFYGLVPRVALLVSAYVMQVRSLKSIRFENMACDTLLMNLTQPILDTRGETGNDVSPTKADSSPPSMGKRGNDTLATPFLAVIPQDIASDCPDDELNLRLETLFGSGFSKRLHVAVSSFADEIQLKKALGSSDFDRTVCLMEAWQPPIMETMDFFRTLRRTGGNNLRIHVLLVGKPKTTTIFTRPTDDDARIWVQKLNSLSDPNIRPTIMTESEEIQR